MISQQQFRQYVQEWKDLDTRYPTPPLYGTPDHDAYVDFMLTKRYEVNQYIITHPKYNLQSSDNSHKYFVTFTYNPQTNREDFIPAVIQQLKRPGIHKSAHYVVEHPDTNIHIHALIESQPGVAITPERYKSHIRKHGLVDVRRIKNDNGIADYMSKENKPIEIKIEK